MPTTTTTVTSTAAQGTTTVTSTSTSPEPASAPVPTLPSMSGGKFVVGQTFKFENQTDRDAFNVALGPIGSLSNSAGGKSCVYNCDTAPTEITMVFIWDSNETFYLTEKLFGAAAVISGLIGKFTCEAFFCGDIDAKTRTILSKWNDAPGFKINICETVIGYADKTDSTLSPDGMLAYGESEFANAADMDEYVATLRLSAPIWMSRCNVVMHGKVSATKMVSIWSLKSKGDVMGWLQSDLASAAMAGGMALIPKMVKFGGYLMGNTEDPEIKAGLAPWTTWKAAPFLSGSLGGKSYSFLQRAVFKDSAARDAAVAALKIAAPSVEGTAAFFHCPCGDSQLWIGHYAEDEANNKKIQAGLAGSAEFMAAFTNGNITHLPHYNAGNAQNTWITDLANWKVAIPALRDSGEPLIYHREGGVGTYGPDSFTIIQECEFVSPEGFQTFMDVQMDPSIQNDPVKYNAAFWQTSPTTITALYSFATSDGWVEANKNFAPFAEKLGPACKKVACYVSGPISAAAQAGMDGWNSAPWCNISTVERIGKMGN